jgi:DNA adenine methylase
MKKWILNNMKDKFIKSSIRWVGGKSKKIKYFIDYFPKDNIEEYREPFLGGSSVYLYMKQLHSDNIKKYWVNDLYVDLYCFYKILQSDGEKLCNDIKELKIQYMNDGRKLYEKFKQDNINDSEYNKALRFFILNKISFSGLTENGTYSQMSFDKNFSLKSIENLKNMIPLFKDTNITNDNYDILLQNINNPENTFIYLDSPYYACVSRKLYGKKGILHSTFDFEKYADNMKNCNAKWCISLDNSEYIKNLFQDFAYIYEIDFGKYSMNNNSKDVKEFIITNYKVENKISINRG